MGDGMKRATLEALCSSGPWATTDGPLDVALLRATYAAIYTGRDTPFHRSDRRMDRALQMLRKAGLIEYAGKPKRWRATGGHYAR